MLGSVLGRVLRHPVRVGLAVAADPVDAWFTMQDKYFERREWGRPRCPYAAEAGWEQRLHDLLHIKWPCEAAKEFWASWPEVIKLLQKKGIRVGPQSMGSWNDGDAGFVRAIYCLTRHLHPNNVVETGVAHGVTSCFVLKALELNGAGHLWSIDRPPLNPLEREQIGAALDDHRHRRWSYIRGSSRRHLPALIDQLGSIDLFVHDSLHSERNVRFEVDHVWKALTTSGALVVDDIDLNWGFCSFAKQFPSHRSMICQAEPLRPDLRRFNQKGLFGIVLKD